MTAISNLVAHNATRWAVARITRGTEFAPVAARLCRDKPRFQALSRATGVPWFVIAVIKEREAGIDQNFERNIAQGDPWNRVSIHVPAGRGPFKSWEDAATDALVNCAPYAAKWKDWSGAGAMTLLEQYNGLGYANMGKPSPYVWSGTDQYVSGKYIADHVFDPNAIDRQLGCAGLILAMKAIDPTISFAPATTTVPPVPPPAPAPTEPAKVGWFAQIVGALTSIFKRK